MPFRMENDSPLVKDVEYLLVRNQCMLNHPSYTNNTKRKLLMIEANKYQRVPFSVLAIQVTGENLSDIAEWCDGQVKATGKVEKGIQTPFVKVQVKRPLNVRQTQAFVGDWVLWNGTGFKVYTDSAFKKCFEEVTGAAKLALDDE